jgi:protein-tyrosine phosphatase
MSLQSAMIEIAKINPFLYLGSYKNPIHNTKQFQELNIDVIINCCNDITYGSNQKHIFENYTVEQYPIDDGIGGSLLNFMDQIVDKIDHYLKLNKKIYVHCVQGRSRSPAIIIYYLMKYEKLTFDESFAKIKSVRPIISMNSNFEKELRSVNV